MLTEGRLDFNSNAHVERDMRYGIIQYMCMRISTHTLTWSVTAYCTLIGLPAKNFNSHAHVERDLEMPDKLHPLQGISTHTLTWSVTILTLFEPYTRFHFNSHAHVERDRHLRSSKSSRQRFQLTRSRGA